MATLTLGLNQKAQMAAKAAYDKEYAACIAEGLSKTEAQQWAQDAGSDAYDITLGNETMGVGVGA